MTPSRLNNEVAREVIRQSVNILRYAEGQAARSLKELMRLDMVLVGLITQQPADKIMSEMLAFARKEIKARISAVEMLVMAEQEQLVVLAANQTAQALNIAMGSAVATGYSGPKFLQAMGKLSVMGKPAVAWWRSQEKDYYNKFAEIVKPGFLTGRPTDQIVKEWQAASGALKANATSLVRTSVLSMANEARLQVYKENPEVVIGYRAVATLDLRTTPLCRARDGMEWRLLDDNFPGPPPWHWNCRSTLVAILVGETEVTGKRASMNGQVPADMTYDEWFKTLSEEEQQDVLGKKKWDIWKRGNLSMRDMIDQKGNPLTIKQLEARK